MGNNSLSTTPFNNAKQGYTNKKEQNLNFKKDGGAF